jgi:hypothetical protein
MSGGATCDKASGSSQDFSAPVTYTVQSSDDAITTVYTVTVNFSQWAYSAWHNDADSGIDVDSEYTVAVNFGSSGAATTVNGVPFEASAISGTNFAIGGGVSTTTDTNSITGSSAALASSFIYDGNPRTVTLTNLTPGLTYETSFFSVGWEASGRILTFATDGDSLVVDQDRYGDNMGIRVHHTFVATDTTKVLSVARGPGGNDGTMHLYALANRVVLPPAHMLSFGLPGTPAVIDPVAKTINWTVPFGTTVTALAPTYTHDGASASPASGSTRNFTSPVTYTVTATDSRTSDYAVTVTVTPVSTAKDMTKVYFPGYGYAWATSASDYLMVVPNATVVTALAPTFSVSQFASSDYLSGTARNFATPRIYRITAQDGSWQDYKVTVQESAIVATGYQGMILASGPVSYWPLNETTGTTAFDLASGLNPITYGGTYTLGEAGLRPDGNPSVLFTTAAGDLANTRAPYSSSLNPNVAFSVECWVKPVDNTTVQYLVALQDRSASVPSPGRWGYAIWKNNGGGAGFGMAWGPYGGNGNGGSMNGATAIVPGTAYHVVYTYDGSKARLYVNGNLDATADAPSYQPASVTQPGFTIGSRNGVSPGPSHIQDVALYSRALTQREIQTHWLGTPPALTYAEWAATKYPAANLSNSAADLDGDGVSNFDEYAFGLDPTKGSSLNPIIAGLKKSTGQFSYTRTENTGLAYTVWTSTNLVTWTQDTLAGAGQTVTATNGGVQTVRVTLSAAAVNGKLFVRVQAQ